MFNRRVSFWSVVFVLALIAVPARGAGRGGGHAAAFSPHRSSPSAMHMGNMHMANMRMANMRMGNMHMGNMNRASTPGVITPRLVMPTLRTPRFTTPVLQSGLATNRVSRGVFQTLPRSIVTTPNFPTTVAAFRHHHHRPYLGPYSSGYGSSGTGGYGGGGDGGGSSGGGSSTFPYWAFISPYSSNVALDPYGTFANPYAVNSGPAAPAAYQTQTPAQQGR
jgi:uncharacterized membrane protein YgcG